MSNTTDDVNPIGDLILQAGSVTSILFDAFHSEDNLVTLEALEDLLIISKDTRNNWLQTLLSNGAIACIYEELGKKELYDEFVQKWYGSIKLMPEFWRNRYRIFTNSFDWSCTGISDDLISSTFEEFKIPIVQEEIGEKMLSARKIAACGESIGLMRWFAMRLIGQCYEQLGLQVEAEREYEDITCERVLFSFFETDPRSIREKQLGF